MTVALIAAFLLGLGIGGGVQTGGTKWAYLLMQRYRSSYPVNDYILTAAEDVRSMAQRGETDPCQSIKK